MLGYCRVMLPNSQQTKHSLSVLISVQLSAVWCLSPNYMPLFRIKLQSSMLVTVILILAVLFSGSARIIFIAVGDSSHCGTQEILMLLGPASISACMNPIPPACLAYLSISMLCILSQHQLWSPVTSMIAGLTRFAAIRFVSF